MSVLYRFLEPLRNNLHLGSSKRCTSHSFSAGLTGPLLTTLATSQHLLSSPGKCCSLHFLAQLIIHHCRYDSVSCMIYPKDPLILWDLGQGSIACRGMCPEISVTSRLIIGLVFICVHCPNVCHCGFHGPDSLMLTVSCIGISPIAFTLVRVQ